MANPIVSIPLQSDGTLATNQALLAKRLGSQAQSLFNQLLAQANTMQAQIWKNPQKMTPQQCWDALGTNAVAFHTAFTALVTFLESISGTALPLSSLPAVTDNADGTVTVVVPSS